MNQSTCFTANSCEFGIAFLQENLPSPVTIQVVGSISAYVGKSYHFHELELGQCIYYGHRGYLSAFKHVEFILDGGERHYLSFRDVQVGRVYTIVSGSEFSLDEALLQIILPVEIEGEPEILKPDQNSVKTISRSFQSVSFEGARIEMVDKFLEEEEIESMPDPLLCVICLDSKKCIMLSPCNHVCICENCSLKNLGRQCPICRTAITAKTKVFI